MPIAGCRLPFLAFAGSSYNKLKRDDPRQARTWYRVREASDITPLQVQMRDPLQILITLN